MASVESTRAGGCPGLLNRGARLRARVVLPLAGWPISRWQRSGASEAEAEAAKGQQQNQCWDLAIVGPSTGPPKPPGPGPGVNGGREVEPRLEAADQGTWGLRIQVWGS
jgi:hypothetical protein